MSAALSVPPAASSHGPIIELSSLRLMREKGIINQAEYDAAIADIAPSVGQLAGDAPSLVFGKFSTTLYGFAEMDVINDSTGSFNDVAGNSLILRPNGVPSAIVPAADQDNYPANHGRTQMSVRNTRLGLQARAPEVYGIRASGLIEADFEGYLPAPNAASGPSQSQFFSSPTLRIRHAYLKLQSPIVDILIGQYWDLFGWQGFYHPNTVQIQGIVGELYSRDAQIRVSHDFRTKAIEADIAVAARRPPSSDSQFPDLQGGLRFAFPWWTGMMTNGATATTIQPMSIAVSGDLRQFMLPELSATPSRTVSLTTEAVALDAFIPIIPAKRVDEGNALSIHGEFVLGDGISDLYTSLTYGLTFPTLANTLVIQNPPTWPQDVDNGMVEYDLNGNLHGIQLRTYLAGLQYYLPGLKGHVWITGNYAHTESPNASQFTQAQPGEPDANSLPLNYTVLSKEDFVDGCAFWQIVPGARIGFEYAFFRDQYADGVAAVNNRFQGSGYFIF